MSPTGGSAPEAHPFAFPWDEAMRLGLHVLRWPPRAFWAASPRELAAAAGIAPRAVARRSDLERLIAAFPDTGV